MLINTDFDEDEDYYEDEHDDFRESHEKGLLLRHSKESCEFLLLLACSAQYTTYQTG